MPSTQQLVTRVEIEQGEFTMEYPSRYEWYPGWETEFEPHYRIPFSISSASMKISTLKCLLLVQETAGLKRRYALSARGLRYDHNHWTICDHGVVELVSSEANTKFPHRDCIPYFIGPAHSS